MMGDTLTPALSRGGERGKEGVGSRLRGNAGGGRGNDGGKLGTREGDETVAPYGPPTYDWAAHFTQ